MTRGIYWMASFPKSGNTWLRIFLTNYLHLPDVADEDQIDINHLERTPIASARPIFDDLAGIESAHLTHDEIDRARPDVYRRWAEQQVGVLNERGLIMSKVHDAYTYLPNGEPIFPVDATAGIIYILRNPLDVAVSYAHHSSITLDQSINLLGAHSHALSYGVRGQPNQLRQKLLTWSQHVTSWDIPNIPRLLIRYEDMTLKPVETFGAVIHFIGEEYDNGRLEDAIEKSRFDNIKSKEDEVGFREKPYKMKTFFRKGKVGNWREHLSPEQAARIVQNHSQVMQKYGYLGPYGGIIY